jgi:hypothetical protein
MMMLWSWMEQALSKLFSPINGEIIAIISSLNIFPNSREQRQGYLNIFPNSREQKQGYLIHKPTIDHQQIDDLY